ncbi:MAG: MATE family efflux transporter [Clostridiaceae bacterium]|nr:MATE family efflux transporter [Eubacteriales bacterium]NLB44402.1 MATE family efflux transporter [Clostridiaceae bacterium]
MENRNELKRLAGTVSKLSLPVLVEQFFIVIMGVINTMLASNMGKEAISAIGMIDTISNIMIALFGALSIGGTVIVAQYTGQKDSAKASQSAAQALLSNLVISAGLAVLLWILRFLIIRALYGDADALVLDYADQYFGISLWSYIPIAMISVSFGILRGSGDTRTPMRISIIMNLCNVLLSYVLIYGLDIRLGGLDLVLPAFGVRGAATGLTSARTIGMLLVLIPLLNGSKRIRLTRLELFRPRWDLLRSIFRLGIPASAEQLMFQGGRLITQTYIVRLGTAAIAANTISISVNSLLMVPGNALAIAATALVGQQIGAGRFKEARKQLNFLILAASAAMALVSLVMLAIKDPVIRLYTHDEQISQLVSVIILSSLVVQPFIWSTSFITPAGLRGAGDIRYTMVVSIISMWLLRILLGYVFAVILPWGVLGVWIAMYVDWLCRSIFFVRRVQRDAWFAKVVIR